MENLYSHPLHEVYYELDDLSNDLTGISELLLTISEDMLCPRDRPAERDYHAELSFLSRQIEKMGADLRTTMEKVKEGIRIISCISEAQSVEEDVE